MPGKSGRNCRATRRKRRRTFEQIFSDIWKRSSCRASRTGSIPTFTDILPSNGTLASVLGDYAKHGAGRAGAVLAIESGADGSGRGGLPTGCARWWGSRREWSGVIHDTASTCTLVALLCAREKTTEYSLARGGLQAGKRRRWWFTRRRTATARWDTVALLAGFGRENVRLVENDGAIRRSPAFVAGETDPRARGHCWKRKPCAIVATSGSTATTAFDPIGAIAEIAKEHGLWLLVDAAMAGSAMILPECRWMWRGVEGDDSLVINAHKWLGAAFLDCLFAVLRARRADSGSV